MDKNKYRGLTLETKKWVYGCLVQSGKYSHIVVDSIEKMHVIIEGKSGEKICKEFIPVNPETIGQFTGLLDKNGKEACRSDKVSIKDGDGIAIGNIIWHQKKGQWFWQCSEIDRSCVTMFIGRSIPLHQIFDEQLRFQGTVIGNVHESPELIEETNA